MASSEQPSLLQFANIRFQGKGLLRLNNTGLAWKAKRTDKSVALIGNDLRGAQWMCLGPKIYRLVLQAKRGITYKFDGFRERDAKTLHSALKEYFNVETQDIEMNTQGLNWGTVNWDEKSLSFLNDDRTIFDLPLTKVQQSFTQKDVVTVEFQQEAKPPVNTDSLVEIRFIVKGDEDTTGISSSEFHKNVLARADISSAVGVSLLAFPHIPMLTPRGRYDVELFDTHMRFHGKTYNYKIMFKSVQRITVLPKPNDKHVCSVISLNPPVRQGHTSYPHIVLQFDKNAEIEELTLNASKEDYREKYKQKGLKRTISGKTHKIFHKALSALVEKPVRRPARTFQSFYNTKAIKCSLKAQDGFLFPLEKAFMFIHKPPTYIRFSDITIVEFARISSEGTAMSGRTFDLVVTSRSTAQEYQFTGMQRNEFKPLFDFIKSKAIKIKKIHGQVEGEGKPQYSGYDDTDDEEDDDFIPGAIQHPPEEYDEGNIPDDDDGDDDDSAPEPSEEEEEVAEKHKKRKRKRRHSKSKKSEKKKKKRHEKHKTSKAE